MINVYKYIIMQLKLFLITLDVNYSVFPHVKYALTQYLKKHFFKIFF